MSIYHPHEISGHVATELSPELYRSWGRTLGYQVAPQAKFVVGGDVRRETPDFRRALCAGLATAGLDVVDLGVLPTPMIYHAMRRLDAAGGAVVTSSYRSSGHHGLKWRIGGRLPDEDDVARLQRESENPGPQPAREPSIPRVLDISYDYVALLQQTFVESRGVDCRVVLDPMFGCNSLRARRYLQAVFPRSLFQAIHDRPDPTFGDRTPDCSDPANVDELSRAVEHERAHAGVAFDGDGDRVTFIDDEGVMLTAEETTCVLLESFGPQWAGQTFTYDVKFSHHVGELATRLGALPAMERSSYAAMWAAMRQSGALFGAGTRGHYFFQSLGGDDDALFAACQFIAWLGRSGRRLSEIRRACPAVFMTPDLRVRCEPAETAAGVQQVRTAFADYPQSEVDGVRVTFPDGWALVRASVHEPALTFRFESTGWGRLGKLVWRFCEQLGELGDTVWARYEEGTGSQCHPG